MKKIILATKNKEISKREIEHTILAKRISDESIVVLKNDGMLPLKSKKVALYGSGARQTIVGGTGSGAMHPRKVTGIEEGLIKSGFDVVTKSWLDKYDNFYDESYKTWKDRIEEKVGNEVNLFKILHVISFDRFLYPTGINVEDEDIYKDIDDCFYVVARQAGESFDRTNKEADYKFDKVEMDNIKKLSKVYKNFSLVINIGGYVDLASLKDLKINSIIFLGQAGLTSGDSFASIVSGEVNPSGKLTSTWPINLDDLPSTKSYSINGDPKEQDYTEGIYVGYRYFDTFKKNVLYPFGYGLSYTKFEYSNYDLTFDGSEFEFSLDCKNIGNVSGKDTPLLFVSIPKVDAELKRLVGFKKTKLLKVNEKERLSIKFNLKDISTYVEEDASFKCLKGNYALLVGSDALNVDVCYSIDIENEKTIEKCVNVCKKNKDFDELKVAYKEFFDVNNVKHLKVSLNKYVTKVNNYDALNVTNNPKIKELLDKMSNEELAELVIGGGMSEQDGERLVTVLGASGTSTSALYTKYSIPNCIFSDGPAGMNVTPRFVVLEDSSIKSLDTYPQYDFGMFGKIMRSRMIGKEEDGVCHYQYATQFPSGLNRAQTWNLELMEEFGSAIAKEMLEFGVTIWNAPGMNINRNILCGRTFEYISEDPVVSGLIAYHTSLGVERHEGVGVSLKHFACNNSEYERHYSSSNLSERALREIYLKGFEIAIKANPKTVMASYNKINGVYNTNNYDLLTKVLRCEWGFKNTVISDWDSVQDDRGDLLKAHKAGCDLIMPGNRKQIDALKDALDKNAVNKDDIYRCAENILNIVLKNKVVDFKL